MFRDVDRPLGGTFLTVDAGGVRAETYWQPRYREPLKATFDDAATLMWDTMRDSIRRRLEGAGRAGIIMSGGVDSTSVAAAASTLPQEPPAAYSAKSESSAGVATNGSTGRRSCTSRRGSTACRGP